MKNLEAGVFGIGVLFDNPSGSRRLSLIGTGFNAHYSNALWTNAHVVQGLEERLDILSDRNPEAVAFRSGSMLRGRDAYVIPDPGLIHPAYDPTGAVGDTPDVGVFFLDDNLSGEGEEGVLSLIPREHVDGLCIGQPVATLGFPAELQFTGGDADNTVNATFKDGTISALRIQGSGDAEYVEVQYNFNTTGGTSGSPVFDQHGWVIAVHFANIEADLDERVPVGSLNFGMRVDALWDFIDFIECCTGPSWPGWEWIRLRGQHVRGHPPGGHHVTHRPPRGHGVRGWSPHLRGIHAPHVRIGVPLIRAVLDQLAKVCVQHRPHFVQILGAGATFGHVGLSRGRGRSVRVDGRPAIGARRFPGACEHVAPLGALPAPRPAVRVRRMGPRPRRRRSRRASGANTRARRAVEDSSATRPLAAADHESGGTRTPRGGVFVDPGRSYGLGFGARGRFRRFRGAAVRERRFLPV